MPSSKIKLVILMIILALGGFVLVKSISKTPNNSTTPTQKRQVSENDSPQIVSTKPENLDQTIISASDIIEITFNKSLQNVPEFKIRIDPKVDIKVELSQDRKTAKIIPIKPYELGSSYTLYINPDTKFDGMGNWGETKTFHFRTIKYTGV